MEKVARTSGSLRRGSGLTGASCCRFYSFSAFRLSSRPPTWHVSFEETQAGRLDCKPMGLLPQALPPTDLLD